MISATCKLQVHRGVGGLQALLCGQVKLTDLPGENGTMEVKGEKARASSTVGGRMGRPPPLALCQLPFIEGMVEYSIRWTSQIQWGLVGSETKRPRRSRQ